MSIGAVGASRGPITLWNNLCLKDKPVGVAQAAALALRMEERETGTDQDEHCNCVPRH